MPFTEEAGNAGTLPPAQIDKPVVKLKVGTTFCVTVSVNEVAVAHCPAPGVNV